MTVEGLGDFGGDLEDIRGGLDGDIGGVNTGDIRGGGRGGIGRTVPPHHGGIGGDDIGGSDIGDGIGGCGIDLTWEDIDEGNSIVR